MDIIIGYRPYYIIINYVLFHRNATLFKKSHV